MFMDIYDQLPSGIGGTVISDQEVFIGYTAYTAIQDWYSGYQMQTYEDPGYACNGTCLAYVPSPGIVGHDCEQERVEIDMATAAEDGTFVFAINFTRYDDTDGLPTLQMTTQGLSAVNENCVGTLVTNTCKMHAGTVDYPVLIDYINVVTNKNLSRRFIGEPYSYPGDLSTAPYGTPAGPLGALKWFGDAYFFPTLQCATIAVQGHTQQIRRVLQLSSTLTLMEATMCKTSIVLSYGEIQLKISYRLSVRCSSGHRFMPDWMPMTIH